MAIYTRNGDLGDTRILGDIKKDKDSEVIEVLGTLDEFNAVVGILLSDIKFSKEAEKFFVGLQSNLLKIGSLIADEESTQDSYLFLKKKTKEIEIYIDELGKSLPQLESFILPGGSRAASRVHYARAVCRRLERVLVSYFKTVTAGKTSTLPYINRLSDLLFVLARYLNFNENVEEIVWDSSNE